MTAPDHLTVDQFIRYVNDNLSTIFESSISVSRAYYLDQASRIMEIVLPDFLEFNTWDVSVNLTDEKDRAFLFTRIIPSCGEDPLGKISEVKLCLSFKFEAFRCLTIGETRAQLKRFYK